MELAGPLALDTELEVYFRQPGDLWHTTEYTGFEFNREVWDRDGNVSHWAEATGG